MSLYSALTQVLAPFAAKIKGIQTGYDGTEYNSPGEAVRGQINDLHVLIGDEPGTAIQASAVAYGNSDVGTELTNVNGRLDELNSSVTNTLLSKVQLVYPINWYNADAVEDGIINVDGTYTENTSYLHTDYIPVKSGDVLGTFRDGNYNRVYNVKIAVFDEDKNALSDKGRNNKTNAAFSIVDGVAYAIVTFRKQDIPSPIRPIITLDGNAPTAYTEYFDPYEVFGEDFLTEESAEALDKLKTNNFSTADLSNAYGCALHKGRIRQTVGLPQKWYKANMATPKTSYINVNIGIQYQSIDNTGVTFRNTTALNSVNGYVWEWFDCLLSKRDEYKGSAGYGGERKIVAENLSDCSLLAIGDSTVDQDTMTQCILDHFTEKGHTITLLGTLGSGDNKNEGRAGWKATDYLTNMVYGGVVNPFYNPNTQTFDFAYYMTNQQYSAPNFVVIQLGINDIYGTYADVKEQIWAAVKTMIDSIIAYDSTIKIILNLPTTPNSDQSKHSVYEFLYRNRLIRYNEYAIAQAAAYGASKVRCSYCHLILDPDTDIRDNVHPTAEGYRKMALEVVNQINCWQNGY